MATLNAGDLTLLDWSKRRDPNGSIAAVVELLSRRSPLIQDAVFKEGNLPTGHRVSMRTGLPSVAWRKFNEGTAASKSKSDQVDEACGMLAGLSRVDCDLAALNGDQAAFRQSEDMAFVASMKNEVETGFFYHSTKTAPEKFMGLAPRLDATTAPYGGTGQQLILTDASPSGSDQTSIWLVGWGDRTVYGIFPKGSNAGLTPHDMGEQLVDDGSSSSKFFRAWVTQWTWKVGLVVEDARYLVRGANIDTSALSKTGTNLVDVMIDMLEAMEDIESVKPVFYMNRKAAKFLRHQVKNSTVNSTLSVDTIAGKRVMSFDSVPVRITDAILNTEAIVS